MERTDLRAGDRQSAKRTLSKVARVAFLAVGLFACALVSPPTGSAATVSCGEVLTSDTVVENDLADCPGDGLVIGAPGIVVDLNGHTIDGETAFCGHAPCERNQGIDNLAGHDGATIKNGTVTGFLEGIGLEDAEDNALEQLTVRAFATQFSNVPFRALTLVGSHDNQIHTVEAEGDPGLTLSASDRNYVSESNLVGQGQPFSGADAVHIVEGSDHNVIQDSVLSGDGDAVGARIWDSTGNEIRGSDLSAQDGGVSLSEGEDTIITDNDLRAFYPGSWAAYIDGDGTRFARNTLHGGLGVTGAFNVISRNDVGTEACGTPAFEVDDGRWNIVKRNYVPNGSLSVAARNTVVRGNYVAGAFCGSSGLYAGPSTILKRNFAVHNAGHGIEASPRAIDAGGNRASFNDKDPQCVNVRCRPAKDCPGFAIGNGALDECENAPPLRDDRTRTEPPAG